MKNSSEVERILAQIGKRGRTAGSFEDELLDFKEPSPSIKDTLARLADASVCFANAKGGTIVLGVSDQAPDRSDAMVGAPPSYSIDAVRKGIFDRTQPPLTVLAREQFEEGARLLIIDVPEGVLFHSNTAGLATRRLGTDCLPFTPEQQRQTLASRGAIDWSGHLTDVNLDGLADSEVARLRRLLLSAGMEDLSQLGDRQMLESLRLIDEAGVATRGAIVLLGTEDAIKVAAPNYGYSYQYRPSSGSEATYSTRGHRPLLAAIEELLETVIARTSAEPLNLPGGVQLQLVDYPEAAAREVIVNAFVHRAYDSAGTVDIEHSPERLTISSPGGLVPGITPENILTHPSTPRNRHLFEVVSTCQLAERTGQGVDRAYREMLRAGKQPPRFDDNSFLTLAVLAGGIGNNSFVRFVNELPAELARDVDVLLALDALRATKSLNANRLAELIQRTPRDAQEVLARIAESRYGLIEATRSTARQTFPAYILTPEPLASMGRAIQYTRRAPDQIDAKVAAHVSEYGFITNRTIQRMFDIHVFAARDVLNDLRSRGLLRKVGTSKGGTGVKYEAGPNFPS